jgi:hypothetical protein
MPSVKDILAAERLMKKHLICEQSKTQSILEIGEGRAAQA